MSRKCSPGEDKKEGVKNGDAKALAADEETPEAHEERDPKPVQAKPPGSLDHSDGPEKPDTGNGLQ